jgi:cellulose synthase/poly-beta-1,6-N-acetylglucosamine synthase-like glycosyltransferase
LVVIVTVVACLWLKDALWPTLRWAVGTGIMMLSVVRIAACTVVRPAPATPVSSTAERVWPVYTVILALDREAPIVPQLMAAIEGLDYPRHRLQVIAAVEADDLATIAACRRERRSLGVELAAAGGGAPRTKPRALNAALALTPGRPSGRL